VELQAGEQNRSQTGVWERERITLCTSVV